MWFRRSRQVSRLSVFGNAIPPLYLFSCVARYYPCLLLVSKKLKRYLWRHTWQPSLKHVTRPSELFCVLVIFIEIKNAQFLEKPLKIWHRFPIPIITYLHFKEFLIKYLLQLLELSKRFLWSERRRRGGSLWQKLNTSLSRVPSPDLLPAVSSVPPRPVPASASCTVYTTYSYTPVVY